MSDAEPGAAADGGGHLGFWDFQLAVAPVAADRRPFGEGGDVPAMGDTIGFQCCFCGATVVRAGPDPILLLIPLSGGGSQELRCHRACLLRVIHPSVPLGVFDDNEAAGAEPIAESDGG